MKLTLGILFGLIQTALLAPSLDPQLVNRLTAEGQLNVLVTMVDQTDEVLVDLQSQIFDSRFERLNTVATTMKTFAELSQAEVQQFLRNLEQPFESLWSTNQIILRNVNLDLVLQLSARSDIKSIEEEQFFPLDEPLDLVVHQNLPPHDPNEFQWGVKAIRAPEVWDTGNHGQDIVIGTIDTGVRGTHEALRDNFVGTYGWYDPGEKTKEPNDNNGHGTHVTANICGTMRNVGVAPASKWIACKGCATSSCSNFDLLACGQFMVCPTNTQGENSDCSKAPHLVSNSWAGGSGNTWYAPTIKLWRTAGIIPVFGQGNSGPECGSANSPGDEPDVIGVGAVDISNTLSPFSSVGPTVIGGRRKPDVAAPGSNVFSAYHLSDQSYASMSGTSMATPHVSGAVTLLLAVDENLSYDTVYVHVAAGSVPTQPTGQTCGDVSDSQYPNNHVGYGRVDAFKIISVFRQMSQ